jgi:hypothetical protein
MQVQPLRLDSPLFDELSQLNDRFEILPVQPAAPASRTANQVFSTGRQQVHVIDECVDAPTLRAQWQASHAIVLVKLWRSLVRGWRWLLFALLSELCGCAVIG